MLNDSLVAIIYLTGKILELFILMILIIVWPLALFAIGIVWHIKWLSIAGIALWVLWVITGRPLQSIKKTFDKTFKE